jgi:WD40 repeat protein
VDSDTGAGHNPYREVRRPIGASEEGVTMIRRRTPARIILSGLSVVLIGVAPASAAAHLHVIASDRSFHTSHVGGGDQLWVSRYDDGANNEDVASSLGVSPNGNWIFVTGESVGPSSTRDYATVSYDALTGQERWTARYNGGLDDYATALAVSPDNSLVFVTGYSDALRGEHYADYATVAYYPFSGAELWAVRYDDPERGPDFASAVAVSPDGSTVYVTGASGGSSGLDYATIAYDAWTGVVRWTTRYAGPEDDQASAIAVSADGSTVFVTGGSAMAGRGYDYTTVAYDASTGTQLWAEGFGGKLNLDDSAVAIRVSPDGSSVFVTGTSYGKHGDDYATIAYDASDGAKRWIARYNGPLRFSWDTASAMSLSPEATTVFVTGSSDNDYATVAYNASTGVRLWARRYNDPTDGDDRAASVAASPDGTLVFVTGSSYGHNGFYDYVTLAYDAASGAKRWLGRYDGPAHGHDYAAALGVGPDGYAVFVTGSSAGANGESDYATLALRTF